MAEIKTVTIDELRQMNDQEGLILQGCGGNLQEWVDGINELFAQAGILQDGSAWKADAVRVFQHDGLTNLLFLFEDVSVDGAKLAMWRIKTREQFGGAWLSDYVPDRLGGFIQEQKPAKPKMELVGQDGNIFGILGRASRLLKQAGQIKQADEMFQRATSSGSYNEALCIISEYVETELSDHTHAQKSIKKKVRNTHER